jgi:hypothetical protein
MLRVAKTPPLRDIVLPDDWSTTLLDDKLHHANVEELESIVRERVETLSAYYLDKWFKSPHVVLDIIQRVQPEWRRCPKEVWSMLVCESMAYQTCGSQMLQPSRASFQGTRYIVSVPEMKLLNCFAGGTVARDWRESGRSDIE